MFRKFKSVVIIITINENNKFIIYITIVNSSAPGSIIRTSILVHNQCCNMVIEATPVGCHL